MEKDFIQNLLNDKFILSAYKYCAEHNTFDFDHGIKHIKNTLSYSEKIFKCFDLSERQKLLIQTCLVFHDIGSLYGRKGHSFKSRVVAQQYLEEKGVFSEAELNEIYYDIEVHDNLNDIENFEYDTAYFVNMIDKSDFAKNRLIDKFDSENKWLIYKDIERIEFRRENQCLEMSLIPVKDAKIDETALFGRSFFNHVAYVFLNFCKHFGLEPVMKLKNQTLDLSKTNKDLVESK